MTTATIESPVAVDERIQCKICNAKVHAMSIHLRDDHPGVTAAQYLADHPGAPMMSAKAQRAVAQREAEKAAAASAAAAAAASVRQNLTVSTDSAFAASPVKVAFHELFELGAHPSALSKSGKAIAITKVAPAGQYLDLVPDLDNNYVFNIDILKSLLMGIEMRWPVYLWGHSGVGKTTIYEQIAARTHRPFLRVQHTANMEEADVVGGWRLRDGATVFEPGPLVQAMRNGWIYCADEYDFARPEVTSVYQAVLEGKPLVIKEADDANRVIRPHEQFRFVATGNTNGQGDETGLYAGTNLQNAANYERFAIVEHMPYMDAELETRLVSQQAEIPIADAKKLVDFATAIRTEFNAGKLSNPISPRSLIYAARIGVARQNYREGLERAFINRLTKVDSEAARQLAQRKFS